MAQFDPSSAVLAPAPGQFDASTATLAPTPGKFDPSTATEAPPAPQRGIAGSLMGGIKAGAAGLLQGAALIESLNPVAYDYMKGLVTGNKTTEAQDWYFKHAVDPLANYAEQQQLTPQESQSFGNKLAYGIGGMVPSAAAAIATGGALEAPAIGGFAGRALMGMGSMATPSALQGVTQATGLVRQGVDLPTAEASGGVQALTGTLMGAIPVAAQGGIATRALTGALSGAATGEAGRVAQNAVLGDHPELQQPFDWTNLAVSGVTGALLGAVLGSNPQKEALKNATAAAQADVEAGTPLPAGAETPPAPVEGGQALVDAALAPKRPGAPLTPEEQIAATLQKTTPPAAADLGLPRVPEAEALNAQQGVDQGMAQVRTEAQDQQQAAFDAGLKTAPVDTLRGMETTPVDNLLAEHQPVAPAAPLGIENRPDPLISFPDGSVGTRAQAEAYIAGLPENQQVAARAKLLGYGAQPVEPDANSLKATWRQQIDASEIDASGLRGQYLAKLNKTISAVDDMATPAEKIAALEKARDAQSQSTISYAVYDKLAENIKAGEPEAAPAPAVEAQQTAAATPQIPASEIPGAASDLPTAAATTEPAVKAADAILSTTPPEVNTAAEPQPVAQSVRERAQEAADRLDTTVASFNARLRAGEELTPLEQERFEDAQGLRSTLNKSLNGGRNDSDAYIKDITDFANQTATPYTKSFRNDFKETGNPEQRSLGIIAELAKPGANAESMLAHLAENGSAPWVRDLAKELQPLGLTTTMASSPLSDLGSGNVGLHKAIENQIDIANGGETEHVVLHELVHAATVNKVFQAMDIGKPANQEEAQLKQSYLGLNKIRYEASQKASVKEHYGLTNVPEFLAEMKTNPDFQNFLSQKGMWGRAVDAVRKMLGMEPAANSMLDRAMKLSGDFYSGQSYGDYLAQQKTTAERNEQFNSSMRGAGDITDDSLTGIAKAIDTIGNKVSLQGLDMAAFRVLARAKTLMYLADRVRALPEMVNAGLDRGVDGIIEAHGNQRQAALRAGENAGLFNDRLQKMFRGMKNDDARALNQKMAEIGTGSSIGGFDPTMNFNDNLAERPELSVSNKPYIDSIYRQYTQLAKSDPKAAAAIVEGAKIHRQATIIDNASIIKNLIEAPSSQTPENASMAAHAAGLDFMSKDLQGQRNTNAKQFIDGHSAALDSRIRAAIADAKQLPEGNTLRAQIEAQADIYDNLVRNPYYSAGRDGNYFLHVGFENMDDATWSKMAKALQGTNKVLGDYTNQDHAFFKFDTMDQAVGMRAKLVAAMGDKLTDGSLASGALSDRSNLSSRAGVSEALRSVLATLHETVDSNPGLQGPQADLMKEAMTRKFLSMLPETSTKMASIKRMGIPGYDGDFQGNFARRAGGGVNDTANIYSAPAFSAAFKQIGAAMDNLSRTGSPEMQEKGQIVADEINTRHANSMQPIDNSTVNLINSLGHSFYLAIAPAFYIRTMAQPWHRGIPILGARYGFANASKEMFGATPVSLAIIKNSIAQGWAEDGLAGLANGSMKFKDMGLTPREEQFVQDLHDSGDLKLGQAQQLQKMIIGGSQKVQDLTRVASMTAQYAEMTNRLITGLSAFRLAEKGRSGVTQDGYDANVKYARTAIINAMDNFDSYNTARAIGKHGVFGPITPLATQFMNYSMQTMQQIARTVHDGMFNRDQSPEGLQRSSEAKKEFAALFATTAMISGAMGLPFVNAAAGVYNTLTQDDNNPTDIRQSARNGLADMFGPEIGNVLSHGIGAAVGVDTSTFGLQNLLPGSEFIASRRLLKDRLDDLSNSMLGPALNGLIDVANAANKISDGYYVKGIEAALPSGLKGYFKAWELADRGYTDSKGNPIGLKATPADIAWQSVGLRPEDKAVQAEAQQYAMADQERLANRSNVIRTHIMQATGDPEAMASAIQEMKEYNQANPYQPITGDALMNTIRQHAVLMATGQLSGTGVGASNTKQYIVQNQKLRFAKGSNSAMP